MGGDFSRLILSRTGLTSVRDVNYLEKCSPAVVPLRHRQKCSRPTLAGIAGGQKWTGLMNFVKAPDWPFGSGSTSGFGSGCDLVDRPLGCSPRRIDGRLTTPAPTHLAGETSKTICEHQSGAVRAEEGVPHGVPSPRRVCGSDGRPVSRVEGRQATGEGGKTTVSRRETRSPCLGTVA